MKSTLKKDCENIKWSYNIKSSICISKAHATTVTAKLTTLFTADCVFSVIDQNVFEAILVKMCENIGWKTLLAWVLIQLWDKWLKCFSDQNVLAKNDRNASAKKKKTDSRNRHFTLDYVNSTANVMNLALFVAQNQICFFVPRKRKPYTFVQTLPYLKHCNFVTAFVVHSC